MSSEDDSNHPSSRMSSDKHKRKINVESEGKTKMQVKEKIQISEIYHEIENDEDDIGGIPTPTSRGLENNFSQDSQICESTGILTSSPNLSEDISYFSESTDSNDDRSVSQESDSDLSANSDGVASITALGYWKLARECESKSYDRKKTLKFYDYALEKFGDHCSIEHDVQYWSAYGECILDAFWFSNDSELLRQAAQVICRAIELDVNKDFAQPFLYLSQIHILLAVCNSSSEEACRRSCYESLKFLKQSFIVLSSQLSKEENTKKPSSSSSYIYDLAQMVTMSYEKSSTFNAVSLPPVLLLLNFWLKHVETIYQATSLPLVSEERSHTMLQLCLDHLLQMRQVLLDMTSMDSDIPNYLHICQLNVRFMEARCLKNMAILFQKYFCQISHAKRYCDLCISNAGYCKDYMDTLIDLIHWDENLPMTRKEGDPKVMECMNDAVLREKEKHKDVHQSLNKEPPLLRSSSPIQWTESEKLNLSPFLQFQPVDIYLMLGDMKYMRSSITNANDDAIDWIKESISDYRDGLTLSPDHESLKVKLLCALRKLEAEAVAAAVDGDEDEDEDEDYEFNEDENPIEDDNNTEDENSIEDAINTSILQKKVETIHHSSSEEEISTSEENLEEELQDLLQDM